MRSERIVVTFCAHTEVRLQANKDIICTISEPHTGEAVESFLRDRGGVIIVSRL